MWEGNIEKFRNWVKRLLLGAFPNWETTWQDSENPNPYVKVL